MLTQYGETKLEDLSWMDRLRLFFVVARYKETSNGQHYIFYKIYRGRKIILREEWYEDGYAEH